jgi:hypothetical protein
MKSIVKIVGVAAGFALLFLFDVISLSVVPEAEAIAGVRRRTARRTAVVVGSASAAQVSAANANAAASQQQAAAAEQEAAEANAQAAAAQQQAAAATAAPAPTAMVASLPAGCVSAGEVFQCGNVYYKPYMSGNQVVYGVVPGP